MITPLMHILSCLNENFEIDAPVDILYLNRKDRDLIVHEAKRLGAFFDDENRIWINESPSGEKMVATTQIISGKAQTLNEYTSLLLTRVWKCFPVYLKEINATSVEVSEDDLSCDAIVLRLEGNSRYIYSYVYRVMEMPSLSYEMKIARLQELLMTIQSHTVVVDDSMKNTRLYARMELHSKLSYWQEMLITDYINYYNKVPPEFSADTISIIRKELSLLGFYGFVNPLEMYQRFNNSRVARKVDIEIEENVIAFLTKVVLSGGVNLNENAR